jgi:hypothetical protein
MFSFLNLFFEHKSFQIAFKFSFGSLSVLFLSSAHYLKNYHQNCSCILESEWIERDFILELRVAWGLKN